MLSALCPLLTVIGGEAAGADLDSLYRCLDKAIVASPRYVEQREHRIDSLRRELAKARDRSERYERTFALYREYKSYMNDSAVAFLKRCISLTDDRTETAVCRSLLAFQCSTTGMYAESLEILGQTDTAGVGREALGEYYLAYGHVYGELAYYGSIPEMCRSYTSRQAEYMRLALEILDPDDDRSMQLREMQCYARQKYDEALRVNDRRMERVGRGSHGYAIVAFYRYMDYKQMGRMDEAKFWLAEAAISDVRNAVMDQAALWELANLLNQEGQLDRSYDYIGFAWDSARRFGTRMRNWQMSPILQTIDKNYQDETERSNMMLRVMIGIVSVMAVMLLGLLFYMKRQHGRLAAAHRELSRKSEQLSQLNGSLREANARLDEANRQMQKTVAMLHEQTKVKEEYIGRFMRLCSLYIDKNDAFRKQVNKMLKNREYEQLYRLTKSEELKNKELDEFSAQFDTAFLNLFPNFVEDFNALLRPEERITVADKGRLNTGLRIFALIRLGIDDSSKIAEFLHYSVNTIYNYRARIKNGAADGRGSFESRVKKIGMPE
ncbi:MAG: transcriptional regulator [Prevotella sp.]|nr:transcriptional regulator [Prevotella sp.]